MARSDEPILYPTTPFPLEPSLVLLGRRGSEAHGTHIAPSDPNGIDDRDLMGVCIPPAEWVLGLREWEGAESIKGVWDVVLYSFRKFVGLLTKQNPNVIGMLWLEEEDYLHLSYVGRELIAHRDLFRSRADAYASFAGYASDQLRKMSTGAFRGYMGARRKQLVEKYGYDCHDDAETEFLTENGWRRFDDVDGRVATLNPVTHALEWQVPIRRVDRVSDDLLFVVEPYSTRAVVTPGHSMLVSPAHRSAANGFSSAYDPEQADWSLRPMRELVDGARSVFHTMLAPAPRTTELADVEDEYLALGGLYLSEGCTQFREGEAFKAIRFTQSKPGAFFAAADRVSARFSARRYDYEKETVWILHGETARRVYADFGHKKEKRLPAWSLGLSARQADVLWDNAMLGDGTVKPTNDTYYTSVKAVADGMQAAMLAAGHPCVVYGPYQADTSYGVTSMYHVVRSHISGRFRTLNVAKRLALGAAPARARDGYPVKEVDGIGRRVVCFEVPNGTLVTRSRGKPAIHGNCKNAAHLVRLLHMGEEYLRTGRLQVRRTWDREMLIAIKRGEWRLGAVQSYAEDVFGKLKAVRTTSALPEVIDMDAVNALVVRCVEAHLGMGHR